MKRSATSRATRFRGRLYILSYFDEPKPAPPTSPTLPRLCPAPAAANRRNQPGLSTALSGNKPRRG
jgi:hypothetical protein